MPGHGTALAFSRRGSIETKNETRIRIRTSRFAVSTIAIIARLFATPLIILDRNSIAEVVELHDLHVVIMVLEGCLVIDTFLCKEAALLNHWNHLHKRICMAKGLCNLNQNL